MENYGGFAQVAEDSPIGSSRESTPGFATPPPHNWNDFNTPITLVQRQRGAEYVAERLQSGALVTPSVAHVMAKTEKASQRLILKGKLTEELLLATTAAEKERQRRKSSSNKVVQKYGEIYRYQARQQIAKELTSQYISQAVFDVALAYLQEKANTCPRKSGVGRVERNSNIPNLFEKIYPFQNFAKKISKSDRLPIFVRGICEQGELSRIGHIDNKTKS